MFLYKVAKSHLFYIIRKVMSGNTLAVGVTCAETRDKYCSDCFRSSHMTSSEIDSGSNITFEYEMSPKELTLN